MQVKGQMRGFTHLKLKKLLKNYRKIRKNLIRNEGRKGMGELKMPLKAD
jgi:hypothetical protein